MFTHSVLLIMSLESQNIKVSQALGIRKILGVASPVASRRWVMANNFFYFLFPKPIRGLKFAWACSHMDDSPKRWTTANSATWLCAAIYPGNDGVIRLLDVATKGCLLDLGWILCFLLNKFVKKYGFCFVFLCLSFPFLISMIGTHGICLHCFADLSIGFS